MEGFTKDDYELLQEGLMSLIPAIEIGATAIAYKGMDIGYKKVIDMNSEEYENLSNQIKMSSNAISNMLIEGRHLPERIEELKKKLEAIKDNFK